MNRRNLYASSIIATIPAWVFACLFATIFREYVKTHPLAPTAVFLFVVPLLGWAIKKFLDRRAK